MKTATIGYFREDGGIQILAALNNAENVLFDCEFMQLVERLVSMFSDTFGHAVYAFEREDIPPVIYPD